MGKNIRPIADFFESDFPSYGAYDNIRKLASYIDGMKISMRKIVCSAMKRNITNPVNKVKTDKVANDAASDTNYLHGSANLCGVCDTMAAAYVGANNYPLLNGNSGGFGSRITPSASAPRYTKLCLSKITQSLINKIDNNVIEEQVFEGDKIEPKYYVPVFPILFLNGSSGMSIGFSHDIYPRNPDEIISYIKKRLSGTEHPRMDLLPWFKGHTGRVEYNKELDRNESYGVVVRNNMTSYTITELPIGVDVSKYAAFLDKLCESGVIQDYDDNKDTAADTIQFDIKTTREFTRKHEDERSLLEVFHLVKSLPETLCCIDENNRVREFKSIQEILDAYIDIRKEYYDKRKTWILNDLKDKLGILASKYLFIEAIVNNKLTINKKKKDEIVSQLEKFEKIRKVNDSYDYLLSMPIHSLTKEKMEELKKQIEEEKEEYKKVKETTIEDMWTNDLSEFKKLLK